MWAIPFYKIDPKDKIILVADNIAVSLIPKLRCSAAVNKNAIAFALEVYTSFIRFKVTSAIWFLFCLYKYSQSNVTA